MLGALAADRLARGAGIMTRGDGETTIMLEAQGFRNTGGWVVDQQFMDQMGAPVLMAHGLGRPVEDATTEVNFPDEGPYHVYVRTRDWVAPWNAEPAPGRFRVLVDGEPLEPVFGTEGEEWHWQDGGTIVPGKGSSEVALRDLTGFDGRCDALVFTTDPDFVPPHGGEDLERFRRQTGAIQGPEETRSYDYVVVGGGIAGTAAAITASRLGAETALIQDRPVLGGNNSSEVRVHALGGILLEPYPKLGQVVKEISAHNLPNAAPAQAYMDEQILRTARAEDRLDLYLEAHAVDLEMDGSRIESVTARHTRSSREMKFSAPLFADCTGDGTLGYLAGADYRMGREGRNQTGESMAPKQPDDMTMGCSTLWNSREANEPVDFPELPWALQFDGDTARVQTKADWKWEAGYNRNMITEFEHVRDYLLRAVYGNWAYLKNNRGDFSHRRLNWVAYVAGKRESRRLLGDVILNQLDIENAKDYPDACVSATWGIDLHHPAPRNAKNFPEPFWAANRHPRQKPYPIPYRCLYSRNVNNMFMAGRDISVTHVALGTVRVMRTCGMMGEVVGMAASVGARDGLTPRAIYSARLDELKELMEAGAGKSD